jgi:hypothetical protein
MNNPKALYEKYELEKENLKDDLQFDMIKRIEAYRRNIDLYNSYGLIKSNPNIPASNKTSNSMK